MAPLATFLLALFPFAVFAAKCDPVPTPLNVTFEYFRFPCERGCQERTVNMSVPDRGSGQAYRQETSRPIFFPHIDQWHSLACADSANNNAKYGPGSNAGCVGNRAVMSLPGNGKKRIGTLAFWATYMVFELKALQFTVLSPLGTKAPKNGKAKIEIIAKRGDGTVSGTFRTEVPFDTRTRLVIPNVEKKKPTPFENISVLEFDTGGLGFVIDEWEIVESAPSLAKECVPKPTSAAGERGPCKPSPTSTKTWTANFDDLPATIETQLPLYYKDVHWPYEYRYVYNSSMSEFLGVPLPVKPDSGENFSPGTPLVITSDTFTDRFGVKSIAVECAGPGQCDILLVGRRDPYDGTGRTVQVRQTAKADNSTFKKIQLSGFDGLWRFDAYATNEGDGWRSALWDTVVLTRELFAPGGAEKCRVTNGIDQLPIEKLSPGSPLPKTLAGFALSDTWSDVSKLPIQPGNSALHFLPNDTNAFFYAGISGLPYTPSHSTRLFDLISFRLTIKISAGTNVQDIRYNVAIRDQCGGTASARYEFEGYLDNWAETKNLWPSLTPPISNKDRYETIVFARPFHAISSFSVNLRTENTTVPWLPLEYWVNEIKYKWVGSDIQKERGCSNCGYRAGEWCEVPRIIR